MTRAIDHRLRIGLAVLFVIFAAMGATKSHAAPLQQAVCRAVDGDTLTCVDSRARRIHIRLSAIDAPELPGHCRKNRHCAPGDPLASKRNLAALVNGQTVSWRSFGKDHYGRTTALPVAAGVNLACAQLEGGFAIYWARYDRFRRLAKSCAAARQ